ncbi:hypothetical protein [Tenacibaculum ovolyticum]|uniref:hypothetical protein n=1 Tax=Tenacibaculum ovolyticum TaxID=104270 RepID=UPI0007ECBD52|nr:hypothetical protein [Tenacibaculum ovolyticum]
MTEVPKELEINIEDNSLSVELEIEVDYRCFITENKAFAPMTVSGSIHNNDSLQDFIKEHKESYSKEYMKVEVMNVRVGDFI